MVQSEKLKSLLEAWRRRIVNINRQLVELNLEKRTLMRKRKALSAERHALGNGCKSLEKVLACIDGSAWVEKEKEQKKIL